jgi:hypothetical protein
MAETQTGICAECGEVILSDHSPNCKPVEAILNELRYRFPNGHPSFIPLTLEELQLHSDKNHDYALGGSPTGNFERIAHILSLYPGLDFADPIVVCLVSMMKQLDAILWGLAKKIKTKVEGLDGRFADVGVYVKIARCMWRDRG